MGRKLAAMIVCALVLCCGTALARRIAWRSTDRPPVSLRLALVLAEEELASEKVEYYCIGASLAKTFSKGDWAFRFASENGKGMSVSVSSDRKVRKSADGFEY